MEPVYPTDELILGNSRCFKSLRTLTLLASSTFEHRFYFSGIIDALLIGVRLHTVSYAFNRRAYHFYRHGTGVVKYLENFFGNVHLEMLPLNGSVIRTNEDNWNLRENETGFMKFIMFCIKFMICIKMKVWEDRTNLRYFEKLNRIW